MTSHRLPEDAFAFYASLGLERSYQSVADHFGVDKKTVLRRARTEGWQQRLEAIETRARERTDQKIAESLEAMNSRHLQTLRVIQGKALEALRTLPVGSAMDAIRALDLAIKQERVIRGEPSERTAVSVEDTIRREYQRWMTGGEGDGEAADLDGEF